MSGGSSAAPVSGLGTGGTAGSDPGSSSSETLPSGFTLCRLRITGAGAGSASSSWSTASPAGAVSSFVPTSSAGAGSAVLSA